MKICNKCNNLLPLSEFYKCKSTKDGLQYICKSCKKKLNKNPRKKEYDRKYSKEYYKDPKNKEKKKEYSKNHFLKNPEYYKNYNKWYKKTEKHIKYRKEYRRKIYKEKYGKDIQWTLKLILRNRLKNAVLKEFKKGKTLELLGCSIKDYKLYLESRFNQNMSWENYGSYWEIDHIKPCSLFNLENEKEQKECFHFSNTQPLEVDKNRQKSSKYE